MELYQNFHIAVNGKHFEIAASNLSPLTTLNTFLREYLHLTGTKRRCLEGGCGACIVAAKRKNIATGEDEIIAVNSCLISIFSAYDWEIYTIEGIGNSKQPHKLQDVITKFHGTQCGYCTPGMIMNMLALKESKNENLTMVEVENSFGGNICRCTGYRSILDAFKSVCKDATPDLIKKCSDIEDLPVCCTKRNGLINSSPNCSFYYKLDNECWMKVVTFNDLFQVIKTFDSTRNGYRKDYTLVAGNTAKGVYKSEPQYKVYVDIQDIPELKIHQITKTGLLIGANLTLTTAMSLFSELSGKRSKLKYLKQLSEHIDLVANVPVRNAGTLAGNLMIKHKYNEFPSDIFLLLETVNATLQIVDMEQKEITVKPIEFLKLNMEDKIIKKIHFPHLSESYKFESYKIMTRAQNTHANINAAFLLKLSEQNIVEEANIVIGCLYPKIHASEVEAYILGKNIFSNEVLLQTCKILNKELSPESKLLRPSAEYLKKCAVSLYYKYILSIAPKNLLSTKNLSGGEKLRRPISKGEQLYDSSKKDMYPVSYPITKKEGILQATGEAEYISDMQDLPGQLYAAFVKAKAEPLSKILKVKKDKALALEGVVAFFDKNDIPGRNSFTPKETGMFTTTSKEEEIFCSGVVRFHSQPIGLIVATSQEMADKGAELVEVEYQKNEEMPLYTAQDVVTNNHKDKIIPDISHKPSKKGSDISNVIKGNWNSSWQAHYYMETQCCNVVYKENGLDIWASTQWMDLAQNAAAIALNIPANMINIQVKRVGGAFGGKLLRNSMVSTAAAIAAYLLKKPVKMWLPFETDFEVIGKRCPTWSNYEVATDKNGVIQYLNNTIYVNHGQGGNEDTMFLTFSNFKLPYRTDCYDIQSYHVETYMHSSAYTRGPGSIEGTGMIESLMDHIAVSTNMDPLEVRFNNMVDNSPVSKYFNDLIEWADIRKRKQEIEQFNKENLWRKKGISAIPLVYGMDIVFSYGVMVSILHSDGSVAVSHGGIEIGQGINTKVIQTCAYKLGIPMEMISVKASNNMIGANSSMAGASITSEGVCWGVIAACDILLERMKPIQNNMQNPTWKDLVQECHRNFVDLIATSKYSKKSPGIDDYVVYAAGASEVEVDILTGQILITRVDILEDVGITMNPEIDMGQIEGAFVMGLGYYCTEKIVVGNKGEILTNRSWNYTVPGAKDIPIDFRVKMPGENPNPVGVLKSKATGEPAICLAVTVPLAIRHALASVRKYFDKSAPVWYPMDGPSNIENTFINSLHNYEKYTL